MLCEPGKPFIYMNFLIHDMYSFIIRLVSGKGKEEI